MMELTVENIKQLIELAVKNKLDRLKVGELEITKTKYDQVAKAEPKTLNTPASVSDPDELLFWSTSSPTLTQEQIAELAVNAPDVKAPKKPRKSTKDNS